MLRSPLVRSPFVCALTLALAGCQPVNKPQTGDSSAEDGPTTNELLIRSIPAEQAANLVFPPPASDRHSRRDLVLDDDSTLTSSKELKVRSPYMSEDSERTFEFSGKCFRIVFTHQIALRRKASLKRPLKADEGILIIDPPVAGKTRWTAGNVLEFCADDHLNPEQTYRATVKGLKSKVTKDQKESEALELSKPWTATFTARISYETAGKTLSYLPEAGNARMITMHPLYGDKVGTRETLAVVFDQAITLEAAAAQIRLVDSHGPRKFRVSHHRGRRFQGVNVNPKQVIFVRPVKGLAAGENLTLSAWDFDGSMDKARSREFTVASPLQLQGITCGYSDSATCDWKQPLLRTSTRDIWLGFNNALAETSKVIRSKVQVSPPVKNLNVWVSNSWDGEGELRISGEFLPSRRYHISVGSLVDSFGNTTRGPVQIDVATEALSASVSMPEGSLLLDEEHSRRFQITTRNVSRGELIFWPIAEGKPDALKRAQAQASTRTLPNGAPAVVLPFSPATKRDEFTTTNVDLLTDLKAGKSYVASVRITDTAHDAAETAYPSWSSAAKPPVVLITPGDSNSLAIHTHSTVNATVVHVARLRSGKPVANATIRINGKPLRGRSTDSKGVVVLPFGLEKARDSLIGIDDGSGNQAQVQLAVDGSRERAYFPGLTSSAAIRVDDLRGMVITDRGIYRPGSTVWIKASVRKRQGSKMAPMASLPVKVRILGPMNDDVLTTTAVTNDVGSIAVQFDVPEQARLGNYQIRVEDALSLASNDSSTSESGGDTKLIAAEFVKIAEFEPPRFTVDVEAKNPSGNALKAKVIGRYLFGAPMDGANVEWTIHRTDADLPAGKMTSSGLAFDARRSWRRWDEDRKPAWSRAGRGELSDSGLFTVRENLDLSGAVAPQRFTLEADITDTSYRHVANRDSVVVHPFDHYVGVKLPKPWSDAHSPVEVSVGVVDQRGKTVVGAEVKAVLERTRWTYTKTRSSSGQNHYEWHQVTTQVGSCTAISAQDPVSCTVNTVGNGEYSVIAEVDGHRGGEASFWAWGDYSDDDDNVVFPSRGRTVDIIADKTSYKPGDTARLLVRSPFPKSTAILTVEQGGLLTHQTVQIDGSTHLFEVPITAGHAPQIHAVVTLLPIDAPAESKAEWKIGALRLPVSLENVSLAVEVTSDKESYEPGQEAKITIKVADGATPRAGAEIALAVVDEGILRMTNFHAANPVKALRPGMPLRFEVSDTRNGLASLLGLSKTPGDGMAGQENTNTRKNFLETALWKPDLRTDSNGEAHISMPLPDNLTRWRMMAVVLDEQGKGGSQENSFTVRKPLMMIPAIPRFAAIGDTFEAAAMVHNNEEHRQKATVKLGDQVKVIDLAASAHQRVGFPITATVAGDLALDFSLKDSGGKTHDAVQVTLPIDAPGVAERPRLDGAFVGKQVITLKIPTSTLVGRETDDYVAVKVGQHLWPELGARLEFLLDYPHGCVEQTTSGILPLLAAREILPRIGFSRLSKQEIDKRIVSGLKRLTTMKTYSGGLGYWPGASSPNVYGTAYAIRAMIIADKAGIKVPEGLLEGALGFLDDQLFSVGEPEVQAAIAQSLAEVGKLSPSSLDALYERADRQGIFGLASLAITFGTFEDQDERTQTLLDMVVQGFDKKGKLTDSVSADDFYYYGSATRTKAQAAIALGRLRPDAPLYRTLLSELADINDSYTTQATAYSLISLSEQLSHSAEKGAAFTVSLDGKVLTAAKELGGGSSEFRIKTADLRGHDAELVLRSESRAAIAFMVSSHWKRALADAGSLEATTADRGAELYRVITDAKGNPIDLANISPGQVLRVSLLAKLPASEQGWGKMNHLAVTDRLPGGFEAVQTDLWTVARAPEITDAHPFFNRLRWGGSDASFIEMHDERVNIYYDQVWGDELVATYLVRALTPGSYTHPPAEAEFMYIGNSTSYSEAGKVVIK